MLYKKIFAKGKVLDVVLGAICVAFIPYWTAWA